MMIRVPKADQVLTIGCMQNLRLLVSLECTYLVSGLYYLFLDDVETRGEGYRLLRILLRPCLVHTYDIS